MTPVPGRRGGHALFWEAMPGERPDGTAAFPLAVSCPACGARVEILLGRVPADPGAAAERAGAVLVEDFPSCPSAASTDLADAVMSE